MNNSKLSHQIDGFLNIMIKMLLMNSALIMDNIMDNVFKHIKIKI
jgi:hypothetical protein